MTDIWIRINTYTRSGITEQAQVDRIRQLEQQNKKLIDRIENIENQFVDRCESDIQ